MNWAWRIELFSYWANSNILFKTYLHWWIWGESMLCAGKMIINKWRISATNEIKADMAIWWSTKELMVIMKYFRLIWNTLVFITRRQKPPECRKKRAYTVKERERERLIQATLDCKTKWRWWIGRQTERDTHNPRLNLREGNWREREQSAVASFLIAPRTPRSISPVQSCFAPWLAHKTANNIYTDNTSAPNWVTKLCNEYNNNKKWNILLRYGLLSVRQNIYARVPMWPFWNTETFTPKPNT